MTTKFPVFLILLAWVVSSCATSNVPAKSPNDGILFTVAGEPVKTEEFKYVYTKNNFNKDSVDLRSDISEYLELFINFKLKVKEAFDLKMDEDLAFVNELEGYRKQLAKPYLKGKEVTDELTEQAYKRMQEEIDVSHILIMTDPDADPADTLKAYNRVLELKAQADAGADFGDLAFQYSEGPSGKPRKGRLGYFSALQMVYPFEDRAYQTEVGAVSAPVRTRFGYHLIKVHARRASKGKVTVSHIMIKTPQEQLSKADSASYKNKVDEIYSQLKNGANWDQLCAQFSDDLNSKRKGGLLNTFGTGAMVAPFEDAAFALENPGDLSEPVRTVYGWHILKLNEKVGMKPFDEAKAEIEKKISHDSRSELNRKLQIQKLSEGKNITAHPEAQALYLKAADSTYQNRSWQSNNYPAGQELTVLTIEDRNLSLAEFYEFVTNNLNGRPDVDPKFSISRLFEKFREDMIIKCEEEDLSAKYPEYRYLYNEYKEGILLFNLMDEKVWSKAVDDTTGIKNHYAANKNNYLWEERADFSHFSAANKDIINQLIDIKDWSNYALPSGSLEMTISKGDTAMSQEQALSLINHLRNWVNKNEIRVVVETNMSTSPVLIREVETYLSRRGYGRKGVDVRRTDTAKEGQLTVSLFGSSPKLMEEYYNRGNALNLSFESGKVERERFDFDADKYWSAGSYQFDSDGRSHLLIVNEILPKSSKELPEVRGLVISDYQDVLEKRWISELKGRYAVQRFPNVLEDLIDELSQ